jgi:hypothetical protein
VTDQAVARGNGALDQGPLDSGSGGIRRGTDPDRFGGGLAVTSASVRAGRYRAPYTTADGSVDAPFLANLVVGRRS